MIRLLPGGRAYGMSPSSFDPAQLAIGQRVEMEHTRDPVIAQRIAMDHLVEDPDYYQKLRLVHLDGLSTRSSLGWAVVGFVLGAAVRVLRRHSGR